MKALKRLGRPRRRLLGGTGIIVLGIVLLAYEYPRFADAWVAMSKTRNVGPEWPPEARQQIQQEMDRVRWDFYEQASLMGLGFLLLLCGVYLCLGSWRKLRALPENR